MVQGVGWVRGCFRTFLAGRQREDDESSGAWWGQAFGPGGRWSAPEVQALRSEVMEVARLFTIAGRMSFNNPEQFKRLHIIIERTRNELADMIYGDGQTTPPNKPTE